MTLSTREQDLFRRATAPQTDRSTAPNALLVFAHPDDEVIAMGARMARFASALLVHTTDGAPRNGEDCRAHGFKSLEAYRDARKVELECALEKAGVGGLRCESLGIADQESALHLLELTQAIVQRIESQRPEVIFTHPYEGGHPDHDACAFAVHQAAFMCRMLAIEVPLIIESPFYHAGPHGIETGVFLRGAEDLPQAVFDLSQEEQERKSALLECFTTQQETLCYFPITREAFRIAPQYRFDLPPHDPPVFYDSFSWGMTSQRFNQLALHALQELNAGAITTCH